MHFLLLQRHIWPSGALLSVLNQENHHRNVDKDRGSWKLNSIKIVINYVNDYIIQQALRRNGLHNTPGQAQLMVLMNINNGCIRKVVRRWASVDGVLMRNREVQYSSNVGSRYIEWTAPMKRLVGAVRNKCVVKRWLFGKWAQCIHMAPTKLQSSPLLKLKRCPWHSVVDKILLLFVADGPLRVHRSNTFNDIFHQYGAGHLR